MTYVKNLGRVKGDSGESFHPTIKNKGLGVYNIEWIGDNGTVLPESELETIYFYPTYNEDTGCLMWSCNKSDMPLPADMLIKGEKGERPSFSMDDDGNFYVDYE